MKRIFVVLLLLIGSFAVAQSNITVSGIVQSEGDILPHTRVAIHLVDVDNVWLSEVAGQTPLSGAFRLQPTDPPASDLRPFRSGSVVLPGLQNEYLVSPSDVKVGVGRFQVYVDQNENGQFDRLYDRWYIGIPFLEEPVGWFNLIYVDKEATITAAGVELKLKPGWNVYTVRFPTEQPEFAVVEVVDDIVLDVMLP